MEGVFKYKGASTAAVSCNGDTKTTAIHSNKTMLKSLTIKFCNGCGSNFFKRKSLHVSLPTQSTQVASIANDKFSGPIKCQFGPKKTMQDARTNLKSKIKIKSKQMNEMPTPTANNAYSFYWYMCSCCTKRIHW